MASASWSFNALQLQFLTGIFSVPISLSFFELLITVRIDVNPSPFNVVINLYSY